MLISQRLLTFVTLEPKPCDFLSSVEHKRRC